MSESEPPIRTHKSRVFFYSVPKGKDYVEIFGEVDGLITDEPVMSIHLAYTTYKTMDELTEVVASMVGNNNVAIRQAMDQKYMERYATDYKSQIAGCLKKAEDLLQHVKNPYDGR